MLVLSLRGQLRKDRDRPLPVAIIPASIIPFLLHSFNVPRQFAAGSSYSIGLAGILSYLLPFLEYLVVF